MIVFSVPKSLTKDVEVQHRRIVRASTATVRATIKKAEGLAKKNHVSIAGWSVESKNLRAMITGYVAGENPYRYEGNLVVPSVPFRRGNRVVRNQAYLNRHYRIDKDVSPPILAVPDKIVGVLHNYMQYANRLPGSGKKGQIKEISVATLEKYQDLLYAFMEEDLQGRI